MIKVAKSSWMITQKNQNPGTSQTCLNGESGQFLNSPFKPFVHAACTRRISTGFNALPRFSLCFCFRLKSHSANTILQHNQLS